MLLQSATEKLNVTIDDPMETSLRLDSVLPQRYILVSPAELELNFMTLFSWAFALSADANWRCMKGRKSDWHHLLSNASSCIKHPIPQSCKARSECIATGGNAVLPTLSRTVATNASHPKHLPPRCKVPECDCIYVPKGRADCLWS